MFISNEIKSSGFISQIRTNLWKWGSNKNPTKQKDAFNFNKHNKTQTMVKKIPT